MLDNSEILRNFAGTTVTLKIVATMFLGDYKDCNFLLRDSRLTRLLGVNLQILNFRAIKNNE